jgi:hypothetical protein
METKLYLDIKAQPDQTTCGPTCLDAVYRYFDDDVPLVRIIREVTALEGPAPRVQGGDLHLQSEGL